MLDVSCDDALRSRGCADPLSGLFWGIVVTLVGRTVGVATRSLRHLT